MRVVVDTCVLLHEALEPERLTKAAVAALDEAEREGELWCSDISFWEVARLIESGRLDPPADEVQFLHHLANVRGIRVQPITPEIARLTSKLGLHRDPADRIIAATAVHLGALLITSDGLLRGSHAVRTLW